MGKFNAVNGDSKLSATVAEHFTTAIIALRNSAASVSEYPEVLEILHSFYRNVEQGIDS